VGYQLLQPNRFVLANTRTCLFTFSCHVAVGACCPAGFGAAAFMAPLLQNLCLSKGDNEEACYCLKVRAAEQKQDLIEAVLLDG
jgi:hypothetical protein